MIGSSPDIAVLEATDAASADGFGGAGHVWCQIPLANAKSSTCLATGPARRPPVEALMSASVPFSITAMAYLGWSTGANAVIQALERSGWPVSLSCAVPVFAAAWMPLSSCMQQLAVPVRTTSCISALRMNAVSGVIGVFHTSGSVVL